MLLNSGMAGRIRRRMDFVTHGSFDTKEEAEMRGLLSWIAPDRKF